MRAPDAVPSYRAGPGGRTRICADERHERGSGRICRRLDGLPLAIELAAARIQVLSPGGAAGAADRSPAAAARRVAGMCPSGSRRWARDRLELRPALPVEQGLLRRLAVFIDGFTLEAAEAVAVPGRELGFDVLDLVTFARGEKPAPANGATLTTRPRYVMLETIREFAGGQERGQRRSRCRARPARGVVPGSSRKVSMIRFEPPIPRPTRWIECPLSMRTCALR